MAAASTPALPPAWTKQVSREAAFAQGACKKCRIGSFELAGRVPGMPSKHLPAAWDLEGSPQTFQHTVAEFSLCQGQLQSFHQAPQHWTGTRGERSGNQQRRFAWCHWLDRESPFVPVQAISSPAPSKTQWQNHVPIQKILHVSNGTVKIIHSFSLSFSMEPHKNRLRGGCRTVPELMERPERSAL